MADTLDVKMVIKHLANGTLGDNLCIICLLPLGDRYENLFTEVCKEDKAYCIAGVLETLADIKFSDAENYNVCLDCFKTASIAYKFHLLTKRSNEILNFYTDAITCNIDSIELLQDQICTNSLCMSLPYINLETTSYDYDMHGIGLSENIETVANEFPKEQCGFKGTKESCIAKQEKLANDNIIVVKDENCKQVFENLPNDGYLVRSSRQETQKLKKETPSVTVEKEKKIRRKRLPMLYRQCSRCTMKYRFLSRLKEHMKCHDVDLHICKVCKFITEDQVEYHTHLKSHTNVHQCATCGLVFKKRNSIIRHLMRHEQENAIGQSETSHVCEVCGAHAASSRELAAHREAKHGWQYTCYYCGRMYRGEAGFEKHVAKHEARAQAGNRSTTDTAKPSKPEVTAKAASKKRECLTCGRLFVDERALLWHQRLHDNDKPYGCEVCGRRFVSSNRRSQHELCAHTQPTRRCPLCPALFHLRSMVNTHVKKVHLTAHKRRIRSSRYGRSDWRAAPVPLQELSVDVQAEILELRAAGHAPWNTMLPDAGMNTDGVV